MGFTITNTGLNINGNGGITFSSAAVGNVVAMEDLIADPRIAGLNRPTGSRGIDSSGNLYVKMSGNGAWGDATKNWILLGQRTELELERDFLLAKVNFTGSPRWETWVFSENDGYINATGSSSKIRTIDGLTVSSGTTAASTCIIYKGIGNNPSTQNYKIIQSGDNVSWGISCRFKLNTDIDLQSAVFIGFYSGLYYVMFGCRGLHSGNTNFLFRTDTALNYYDTGIVKDTNWHIFRAWRQKGVSNGTTYLSLDGVVVTPPNAADLYPINTCTPFIFVGNGTTAADISTTVSWITSLTEF